MRLDHHAVDLSIEPKTLCAHCIPPSPMLGAAQICYMQGCPIFPNVVQLKMIAIGTVADSIFRHSSRNLYPSNDAASSIRWMTRFMRCVDGGATDREYIFTFSAHISEIIYYVVSRPFLLSKGRNLMHTSYSWIENLRGSISILSMVDQ